MKERLKAVLLSLFTIVLIGIVYILIINIFEFSIPCIFYTVTGYKCPGCGITRMFLSLIDMNIEEAYKVNPVLFILMPVIVIMVIIQTTGYIRHGRYICSKWENVILIIILIILIIWGFLRNINV